MAAPTNVKPKGCECLVFGCKRRSRKSWALYICGKHWPMANREQKRELRRLDRIYRREPGTHWTPETRRLWRAIEVEYEKLAALIFDLEAGHT